MTYDLVVKNGRVIDPSQGLDGVRDVAFTGGRVAAVELDISSKEAREVVDAAGLVVTPGLIDLHVHVYPGVSHFGVDADYGNVSRGVTTAVDAGSSGAATFGAFRKYVLERADTRLYALLNISLTGMITRKVGELEDMRHADVGEAVRVAEQNRDYVIGIKARLSRTLARDQDIEVLKRAIDAAAALDAFVMIHVGHTETPMEKLVQMLRPGDVVTHTYHGNDHGILTDAGRVMPEMWDAQRRGVIFDVGHGAGSFSFDVAEKALADNFFPGNISSDLHVYNIEGPVYDQVTTISKFLYLGMSLSDIVRLTTQQTASVMGVRSGIGTLAVGAPGDATVMRLDEGSFVFTDSKGRSVTGRERLSHVATVRGGRVYRAWDR